jgi:chromosome segregation ATPase
MNDDTNKKQTDDNVLRASGVEIVDDGGTVAKLEEEFQKELAPHPVQKKQTAQTSSLAEKLENLGETEQKIEKEIHELEADVKGKLTNLKQIRADIEKELEEIKELQAAEGKIKEERQKVADLEESRQKIEDEITALEEGVLKNLD